MRLFLIGATLLCATGACSAITGLDDFDEATDVPASSNGGGGASSDGGGPTSSSGGATSASGGSASGGATSASGGTGGAPEPVCGNGIIEGDEQCDAGSQTNFCNADCQVTGCNSSFDHFDATTGHCYRYSDDDGQVGNHQQAQGFCTSWGGALLVLNSADERAFIVSLLDTLRYSGQEYLWVGARDMDGDGDYTWRDDSPLPSSSALWNIPPPSGGCVAINPVGGGLVASANCLGTDLDTFHLHFACERAPEGL